MVKKLFRKHIPATYQVGLMLARSHRVLKEYTDDVLRPYNITSVDWAILGLLHDAKPSAQRLMDLSEALGVEPPFTTKRIERLVQLELVKVLTGTADKRERFASITPAGITLITTVEPLLKTASRTWLQGTSPLEVYGFIKVITAICSRKNDNQ